MGRLRIKCKSFGLPYRESGRRKLGIVACQRHRIARNVYQAVHGTGHEGFQDFVRKTCPRRVHDKRRRLIHHVLPQPFFGRGRHVFDRRRSTVSAGFQVRFCMHEAAMVAFHRRNPLKLVLQQGGKKAYPAKEVDKPFVARSTACNAIVHGIAHGLHKLGQ